jgi:hypothetical protein
MTLALTALSALLLTSAHAATEDMPGMPLAREKRVTTVSGQEDLTRSMGFGANEAEIEAMNLMMIESAHPRSTPKAAAPYVIQAAWSATPVRTGSRALAFVVLDPKTQTPLAGLHLSAELAMTGMNMGSRKIPIQETEPGRYLAQLSLAMTGRWSLRIGADDWETQLAFDVEAGP